MQKKFIEGGKFGEYLIEHTVRGDSGDGIPNMFSKDDVFVNDEDRQTPVTAKKLARFFELGRDACENDDQRRGWDRNQMLVDFYQSQIDKLTSPSILQQPAGKFTFKNIFDISNPIICILYIVCDFIRRFYRHRR
jgi:hypothetical protein